MNSAHYVLPRRVNNILQAVTLQKQVADRIHELEAALHHVRRLQGLPPICVYCKKIRDDQGYWQQVESYLKEQTGAELTHGLCPECIKKLYPDLKITSRVTP